MLSVVQLDAHRNGGEAARSNTINHLAEMQLVTLKMFSVLREMIVILKLKCMVITCWMAGIICDKNL